jgi:hypothetical protein
MPDYFINHINLNDLSGSPDWLTTWALRVVDRAPVFFHGAGRALARDDRQMIIDDVVAELYTNPSAVISRIQTSFPPAQHEVRLRSVLWNRAAELVAQHCSARDPEWKNARRRVDSFLRTEAAAWGLVSFSAYGARYVCMESPTPRRDLPVIPRDDLERSYPARLDSLKYGDGLGQFMIDILEDLRGNGQFRSWLSIDDLAHVLARGQERIGCESWVGTTALSASDETAAEVGAVFAKAENAVIKWFEEKYSPGKGYSRETKTAIRSALSDHINILAHDSANHPGLTVLIGQYFPQQPAANYRNSSLRTDFEYIVRRFAGELKRAAAPILQD